MLIDDPDLYVDLDKNREKINAFVEESLRVRAPTQGLSTRMTTQDEVFKVLMFKRINSSFEIWCSKCRS